MNNIIMEMIKKYRLKLVYRGVVNPEEGIGSGVTPTKEDIVFIKENRDKFLHVLKEMKKEKEMLLAREYEEKQNAEFKLKYPKEFAKAAAENIDVKIGSWEEPCNSSKEECNLDIVTRFVKPDGSVYVKRQHTW